MDFATNALRRAAAHAEAEGAETAARIEWLHADLRVWSPPGGGFDLVSAQYMHLPPAERRDLFARLAAAVAPGGTLLIVGHDISDLETGAHRPDMPEMFFTADEVAGSLDPPVGTSSRRGAPAAWPRARGGAHHRARRHRHGPAAALTMFAEGQFLRSELPLGPLRRRQPPGVACRSSRGVTRSARYRLRAGAALRPVHFDDLPGAQGSAGAGVQGAGLDPAVARQIRALHDPDVPALVPPNDGAHARPAARHRPRVRGARAGSKPTQAGRGSRMVRG